MPVAQEIEVLSQKEVAPHHFRIALNAAKIAVEAHAGQFVHVLPRTNYSCDPLLRRAFSILRIKTGTIELLYRIEGRGTSALAKLKSGDILNVLGPLGQGFAPVSSNSLFVGGGVGVPPLAMLASTLSTREYAVRALIGSRSSTDLICLDDFAEYDIPVEIATDDGTAGHHGRVTDLLEAQLQSRVGDKLRVYACGPLPMLREVARLCQEYSVPAQVSLEENMPCGVGVCNGCVLPVLGPASDYDRYRRICVQGPVLWAHEVDWRHYEGSC